MSIPTMLPADLEKLLATLHRFESDPQYAEHINAIFKFASEFSGVPRQFLEDALTARNTSNFYGFSSIAHSASEKTNTKISYLYRDADNYKVRNSCVINGILTKKQQDIILGCLSEGEYFIPSLVGMPEVKFDEYDADADHDWFELSEHSFEKTSQKPDLTISPEDLVAAFCRCKGRWEEIFYQGVQHEGESADSRVYDLSGEMLTRNEFLAAGLDELDLSVRAYNCLRRAGVSKIGQLISMTEEDLKKVRNLGWKCFDEITGTLARYGESLDPGNTLTNKGAPDLNHMIADAATRKEQQAAKDEPSTLAQNR